jgi:hypothetical protein
LADGAGGEGAFPESPQRIRCFHGSVASLVSGQSSTDGEPLRK